MPSEMNSRIQVSNLAKTYRSESQEVHALQGVSFEIKSNEFCVVMGASGSGKSTLLYLLGGLDSPTQGTVKIDGQIVGKMSDEELSKFRRQRLGFIFQSYNLVPSLTAIENVALPKLLDGHSLKKIREEAQHWLDQVGLSTKSNFYPSQLSGGEMQRVAIARSLIGNPSVIFADEPTGNLDSKTGDVVISLLKNLSGQNNKTVIMVTHDPRGEAWGSRLIKMKDGKIESDSQKR